MIKLIAFMKKVFTLQNATKHSTSVLSLNYTTTYSEKKYALDTTKALFLCHTKINSQNDFTSKTAKVNHVRSNSKFQIKSIQHDFIFLSLI